MGGYMAAATGALFPEPIAVVPCVTGINPAPVFTDGMLSRYVDWSCLAGEVGGVPEAKAHLGEILGRADLGRLEPPRAAAATLLIAARRDGYVPPPTVDRHRTRRHIRGVARGAGRCRTRRIPESGARVVRPGGAPPPRACRFGIHAGSAVDAAGACYHPRREHSSVVMPAERERS
jgi:hypothetical protein